MAITQNSRVYGNNSGTDVQLKVNADGELAINLEEADIQIGAVEIKDATTTNRAVVSAAGEVLVEAVQATHDDLNANANLQVGNADVANGNPVPVSDAGGALSIDVGGTAPGLDNTNELKVSLYGKNASAGDTPLLVDAAGNPQCDIVGSLPAGTAIIGQVSIDQTTDGTTNKVRAFQPTHDNLNLNANIQVGNADAANGNPVPVSDAGGALSIDVGGVVPGLDNTNKISVSVWVKTAAAGDTALTLGQTTKAASVPVVLASDQDDIKVTLDGESIKIDQTTPGTTNGVVVNSITAGSNIIGKMGIDQTTPGTTNGVQVNAALPAGTNLMGKVGIDQTTPGTTNGVQVNAGTAIMGKVGIDQTTPGTTNGVQVNAALPAGTNLMGKVGIDQTTPGTTNGVVINSIVAGDTNIGNVDLASALSSEYDSIDVSKMSKGTVTTAHSAITGTATSAEIDCRGFNAISVEMACSAFSSGNWVASILGCAISGGTFGVCYSPKDDGSHVAQATPAISANGNTTYYFRGVPNYVKILATRTTDGTLTCKVTPTNL